MEAAHTNPILICFCSLLYYKNLNEHLYRFKIEKKFIIQKEEIDLSIMKLQLRKFTGTLPNYEIKCKKYDRKILNKWHLILRLYLNKELTIYRYHYIVNKRRKNIEVLKNILIINKPIETIYENLESKKDETSIVTKF